MVSLQDLQSTVMLIFFADKIKTKKLKKFIQLFRNSYLSSMLQGLNESVFIKYLTHLLYISLIHDPIPIYNPTSEIVGLILKMQIKGEKNMTLII